MAEKKWELVEPTYTGYISHNPFGIYADIIRGFMETGREELEVAMDGKTFNIYIGLRRAAAQMGVQDRIKVSKRRDKINLVRVG